MMAAHANKWPAWITTVVLFCLLVSVDVSSSQCVDGTYDYDGRKCCECGIGLFVKEHCTANLQYGECEPCIGDTFSSHPTGQTSCEPCTSCSHDSANLEEEEPCTRAKDRKCRCKKDHYSISGKDSSKLCSPCTTCPKGIKEPCAGHNDTVCNDKIEVIDHKGTIAGIIVAVLAVGAVLAGAIYWFYWRKKQRQNTLPQLPNGNAGSPDVELVERRPLIKIPDMDLQPHLHDLAEVVGWNVMKDIAMRSEIPKPRIDNCERNHPHDAHEQTVELLDIWVQSQGLVAGDKLYHMLENTDRRLMADKVRNKLLPSQT